MAAPEEWVPSFGIGIMVSGFLAFVVGTAMFFLARTKNNFDMEKAGKKHEWQRKKHENELEKYALEKAEAEVKNAEREAKKLAADSGLENAREEGQVAALKQGRVVRGVLQEAAEEDRLAFEFAMKSANKRWEEASAALGDKKRSAGRKF